jgi:multisubunit Na+/H+ antiporter MnhB subunit
MTATHAGERAPAFPKGRLGISWESPLVLKLAFLDRHGADPGQAGLVDLHPAYEDTAAAPHRGAPGIAPVSRVIYGSIIGLAIVVALEAHPPPTGAVIATLVGTAVAIALAELYSELIGFETRGRRDATRAERQSLAADVAAVSIGIAFPAVFFLLAAAGVLEEDTAFTVSKWTGFGLIGAYGYAGSRLAGTGLVGSLVRGAGVALIGAFLIALKALVH